MKAQVLDLKMKKKSEIELDKSIFSEEINKDTVSRVVNWQRAKRQSGLHYTKGRSDVIGTGKKPFRQKGTGNARQGSRYVSQMRGGGVVFGPLVRSHAHKLPKKIKQKALKMVLTDKLTSKNLIILDKFEAKDHKTKNAAKLFSKDQGSVLMVYEGELNENFARSVQNLHWVNLISIDGLNVYDVILHDKLMITETALKKLEERLS